MNGLNLNEKPEPERTMMMLFVEPDEYGAQKVTFACPENCGCTRYQDALEPNGLRVCPLSINDYIDMAYTNIDGIPVWVVVKGIEHRTPDGVEYDVEVTILPTGDD